MSEDKPAGPFRIVAINGGEVVAPPRGSASDWEFRLGPVSSGYADAQVDDYGGRRRADYPWVRGVRLQLEARFSERQAGLIGTAGFGFWNAPFGPGTGPLPTLPQAAWYFFGSPRNNLPFAPPGAEGNGWFAATIDAGAPRALATAPLAPLALLLNQIAPVQRRVWALVRPALRISFQRVRQAMDEWHQYELEWRQAGCVFRVDGVSVLETPYSPRGPLGLVAWMDNQYMVATPAGRFRWGTEPVLHSQSLALRGLELARLAEH